MADVIFIYPSTTLDKKGSSIGIPMAALQSLTLLDKEGFTSKIIDQRIDKNWRNTLIKSLKEKPVCIGVSAMTGAQIAGGLEASKIAKRLSNIAVIWGGVHASLMPFQTIKNKNIDIIATGEGEETFLELVKNLKQKKPISNIKSTIYKDPKIHATPRRPFMDLKKLPSQPYHLINIKNYFLNLYQSKKTLSLLTGKGCPHRCKYCYNTSYNKRTYRPIPPEKTIKDIKKLVSFGAKTIDLVDDNFFVNQERVREFCNLLTKEKINIKFMTNCRIDYIARWDIDFLKLLRKCGFHEFFIGIESGSNRVLSSIKKDITVEQIIEGNKKLREAGIKPIYSFMGGFPGEKTSDIKQTIDVMLRLIKDNPNASLTAIKIYTPFPGSELFDECVKNGFKPPTSLEGWASFNYNTSKYKWGSKKDMKLLEKLSYLTYFLDQKTMIQHMGTNALLRLGINIYCKIVRFRCTHHFYFFTPETRIFRIVHKKFFK